MTNQLITSYIDYIAKRNAIRGRQRKELQEELKPALKAFGRAIIDAQKNGKRIEDIEFAIGTKNRTLIYNAKRAAKGIDAPEAPTPQEETESPSEKRWAVVPGIMDDDRRIFYVYIDENPRGSIIVEHDNDLIIPDVWAADTENQTLYREIIAHIKTQV